MQVTATAALVVTDLKEERGGLLEWGGEVSDSQTLCNPEAR